MATVFPEEIQPFDEAIDNELFQVDLHPALHTKIGDTLVAIQEKIGADAFPGETLKDKIAEALAGIGGGAGGMFITADIDDAADPDEQIETLRDIVDGLAAEAIATIFVPRGDYSFDVEAVGGIDVEDRKITFAGVEGATTITISNDPLIGDTYLFKVGDGGSVILKDLVINGPANIGVPGIFDVIYADGDTGYMRAEHCVFNKAQSMLRVSSAGNWLGNVEAYWCEFIGYATGDEQEFCTPVMLNSDGTGGEKLCRVMFCTFRDFGQSADNHFHGLYIYTDWCFEIAFNRFLSSVGTGYCCHIYDEGTTDADAGKHQKIVGNYFGPDLTVGCVVAARGAIPLIQANTFAADTIWIGFDDGGGADILDNDFCGEGATTGIEPQSDGGTKGVRIGRNLFRGFKTRFIWGGLGEWDIYDNVFKPNAAITNAIRIEDNGVYKLRGNKYLGTATEWVYVPAAVGAADVTCEGERFRSTAGACLRNADATAIWRVIGCEFNQVAGASFTQTAAPATYLSRGNYGTNALVETRGLGIIDAGSTAATARPVGEFAQYIWLCTVEPTNLANGDIWVNTA
jgi:hypothetical protein